MRIWIVNSRSLIWFVCECLGILCCSCYCSRSYLFKSSSWLFLIVDFVMICLILELVDDWMIDLLGVGVSPCRIFLWSVIIHCLLERMPPKEKKSALVWVRNADLLIRRRSRSLLTKHWIRLLSRDGRLLWIISLVSPLRCNVEWRCVICSLESLQVYLLGWRFRHFLSLLFLCSLK